MSQKRRLWCDEEKIKDKYFTTSDYNKFTKNILDEKITAKKLVNDTVFNEKIKTLITKEELKKYEQR